jgi:protein TonB
MERAFQSPGWRTPTAIAAGLHAAVVLTGVWPTAAGPAAAPEEPRSLRPLELTALDPLQSARLLSSVGGASRPGLAEAPRAAGTGPRLAPEATPLEPLAARRPAWTLPEGGRAAPPARLLEARGEQAREHSRLERLRPPPRSLAELLGAAPLPAPEAASAPSELPGQPLPILLEGRALDGLTLYREQPWIGPELQQSGLAGVALVEFAVDPEGLVESVILVEGSGHEALDRAALAAARRWRFDPRALERAGQNRCRYRFQIDARRGPP